MGHVVYQLVKPTYRKLSLNRSLKKMDHPSVEQWINLNITQPQKRRENCHLLLQMSFATVEDGSTTDYILFLS